MQGITVDDITNLLRQKGLAMAGRYDHLGPSRLHEAVAQLMDAPAQCGTKFGMERKRPAVKVIVTDLK
jgi:hypothetical protein